MPWFLLIIGSLLGIYLLIEWKKMNYRKIYKNMEYNSSSSLPFIGHVHLYRGNSEDRLKTLMNIGKDSYEKGGLIFHWHIYKPNFHVCDPEIAGIILKNCLEKHDIMQFMKPLLGHGSVIAPVPIWRPRRKIVASTFSLKNINNYVSIFAQNSSIMVDKLKENLGKGEFAFWKYASAYAMDTVCESTLGIKIYAQQQKEQSPVFQALELATEVFTTRSFRAWLYSDAIFRLQSWYPEYDNANKLLQNYVKEIISNRKQTLGQNEPEQGNNMLDMLLRFSNTQDGFGDIEILEEVLVIFIAGPDTSAVSLSFTALMLSQHPSVQERCYEELMEVFGDSERAVCPEDLPRLKYMDAVIKETLRYYPPGSYINRKLDKDVTLPSGVVLQEGLSIIVSIFAIHRNPKYWGDDADQFRPERFLDAAPRHPNAFMPFSLAPRGCTGSIFALASLKTALATLLRSYRLLPPTEQELLRLKFCITIKDVNNFKIRLEKRSRTL